MTRQNPQIARHCFRLDSAFGVGPHERVKPDTGGEMKTDKQDSV